MAFLQLILETNQELAEFCEDCLLAADALSVTYQNAKSSSEDEIFEPEPDSTPLWNKIKISALFEANTNIPTLKQTLKLDLPDDVFSTITIEPLEDINWVEKTQKDFKPMLFGKNLWICPSWSEIPDPTAVNILLDPGVAFGTGTHATTRLCLEWLEKHPSRDALVIDYGCGSGILGIAAMKLGARKVFAIDHDNQALLSTQSNAKQNNILHKEIETFLPEEFIKTIEKENIKCDLILANILATPLIELAPKFASFLKEGGHIVLSGILENQSNDILKAYQNHFLHFDIKKLEDWILITARRGT